jgi:hypothetical protein
MITNRKGSKRPPPCGTSAEADIGVAIRDHPNGDLVSHAGMRNTGLIAMPATASAAARLMSAKS